MQVEGVKRIMRNELGRPIAPDRPTKPPSLRRTVGNPCVTGLPLRLGIIDKPIRALVEHIVGNRNLTDNIAAPGAIGAEDLQAIGMRQVDQIGGEHRLRRAVGIVVIYLVAGAGLHDHVTQSLAPHVLEERVLIRHGGDIVRGKMIGGVVHQVEPSPLAKVGRVDAAIPDLAACGRAGESERQQGKN